MKPCTYRRRSFEAGHVSCICPSLIHSGSFPAEICDECPFSTTEVTPGPDFFTQTKSLLVQLQHSGQYRPVPRPCGGCNETKHRIPDGKVTQFVWPYYSGAADADELRWSIRSVETFFQGRVKITIIGDRPEWYYGHVIRKRRVPSSKTNRRYRDMLSKVFFIASHAEIDADCVWMMDDIYFLKPFTLEDVQTPRSEPWTPSQSNGWQKRKTCTMQALADRGATQHDYATHLPHWLEKSKLREMFDGFNLHENTMLWEVLYGNLYRENPSRTRPFFVRFQHVADAATFRRQTAAATVMNHNEAAWCEGLRDFLAELLPTPASVEGERAEPKPVYVVRKKARRTVKRRPLETHRAYIEALAASGEPSGVSPQTNTPTHVPHIMIIQAAYTDPRLSARRLEISRHTSIPSLRYQSQKPVVHIAVNPDDPLLNERLEAFQSTGCEVKPLYRSSWRLYRENWELPEGRKIVSRMDDDDVICQEYCERTRAAAPESGEWNLIWPNGYVFWRETCFQLHHRGIQFVTLVTDHDKDPHQEQHWQYHKLWPTRVVSNAVGWIWVRHGDAATSTLPRYRKVKKGGIDAKRIPINLRAILRAIADSGQASGNYREHRNQQLLKHVINQNEQHAPIHTGTN